MKDWPRPVVWTAKTHVACQGLDANALTLARFYRRHISMGRVWPDTTVVYDEISGCCILPLARLGCQLLLADRRHRGRE